MGQFRVIFGPYIMLYAQYYIVLHSNIGPFWDPYFKTFITILSTFVKHINIDSLILRHIDASGQDGPKRGHFWTIWIGPISCYIAQYYIVLHSKLDHFWDPIFGPFLSILSIFVKHINIDSLIFRHIDASGQEGPKSGHFWVIFGPLSYTIFSILRNI